MAYTCLALMVVSWAFCKGRKVGYCPIYPQTFYLHSYGGSRLAYAMYPIIWRGGGRGTRNVEIILIQNSASISQREIPTFATIQVKPFNFSQPHILPFLNGTKHTLPGSWLHHSCSVSVHAPSSSCVRANCFVFPLSLHFDVFRVVLKTQKTAQE